MTANGEAHVAYQLSTRFEGVEVIHTELEGIKRWKRKRMLGRGAFGIVWLEEEAGGELRAVKILSPNLPGVNWSRELDALVRVKSHKDLFVQFLGWYRKEESIILAMEYVEHGDLADYLRSNRQEAKQESKEIIKQLLQGLVVLHELRICHRDLKPQNVLITSLSPIKVKITDFGVSKHTQDTSLRTGRGTRFYMAPEILGMLSQSSRKSYTFSVDIWSLGVITHEVLTGEIPFSEGSVTGFGVSALADESITGVVPPAAQVNTILLVNYCQSLEHFPMGALLRSRVSKGAVEFVKRLMCASPASRMTAEQALASPWLLDKIREGTDECVAFEDYREPILPEECHRRLSKHVESKGLQSFYPSISDSLGSQAARMANHLTTSGASRVLAIQLTLLVLYDLVVLIDDSDSTRDGEDGSRIETIQQTLRMVASIYGQARDQGINAIHFCNDKTGRKNITELTVSSVLQSHNWGGLQKTGTALKQKILDKYMSDEMEKPLLIIVLTSGRSDGEPTDYLYEVIANSIETQHKKNSVAFQLTRVGNDPSVKLLFEGLATHPNVGPYVNCLPPYDSLEDNHPEMYWFLANKLLLGAIVADWGAARELINDDSDDSDV